MIVQDSDATMAVFLDLENIALGAHEADFPAFDIRKVLDALDLCYTKSHVDTFIIISGDSDFSPLVSKLRENNKTVIGVGVKKSTSDLFISNCDEFLYYDDLVRAEPAKKRVGTAAIESPPEDGETKSEGLSPDRALDLLSKTLNALRAERGDD